MTARCSLPIFACAVWLGCGGGSSTGPGPEAAEPGPLAAAVAAACEDLHAKMRECAAEAAGVASLPADLDARLGEAAQATCERWEADGEARVRAAQEALDACVDALCEDFSLCMRQAMAAAETQEQAGETPEDVEAPPDDGYGEVSYDYDSTGTGSYPDQQYDYLGAGTDYDEATGEPGDEEPYDDTAGGTDEAPPLESDPRCDPFVAATEACAAESAGGAAIDAETRRQLHDSFMQSCVTIIRSFGEPAVEGLRSCAERPCAELPDCLSGVLRDVSAPPP
jgi:hypothetical protein